MENKYQEILMITLERLREQAAELEFDYCLAAKKVEILEEQMARYEEIITSIEDEIHEAEEEKVN